MEKRPLHLFVVREGAAAAAVRVSHIDRHVAEELHLAGRLVAVVKLEGPGMLAEAAILPVDEGIRTDLAETGLQVRETPHLGRSWREMEVLVLGELVSWAVEMMPEDRCP